MRKYFLLSALLIAFLFATVGARAQQQGPDPDFFIYLCIGQSNMEAGARPDPQDKWPVDSRFQFMAAVDMPKFERTMGHWYTAEPPICRQENNLGPVDFFGRNMVRSLPKEYRVGVINVSVAGAKIELWDKDGYKSYIDTAATWMQNICKAYDGNPYGRLVDMARLAQKDGVIKGLLIHQGESNSEDPMWPRKIKGIYDNLVKDLGLNPADFFVLAGELKPKAENGVCYPFNTNILPNLPNILPNSYIISSEGCQGLKDPWHFTTAGFRELGKRYAIKALEIQGFPYRGQAATNDPRTADYYMELNVDKLGIDILPTLNGIFYEDINQSNDGGICAQLIQNNSFQMYDVPEGDPKEFSNDPSQIYGWTVVSEGDAEGSALTVEGKPLVKEFPHYYDFDPNDKYDDNLKYRQFCVKFDIKKAGEGFGLAANGYGIAPYGNPREGKYYYSTNTQKPSLPVKKDVSYDLGLYLLGKYKGNITVYLETAAGKVNSNVYTISKLGNKWTKYTTSLKALSSEDSRLVIKGDAAGKFYLDFVTLVPEASELWMDGKYGDFRKDMMQALYDLKPQFMRFPGGCASEGPNYWGQVFWKTSIGPKEERIGFRNHWGTWTSQHIGFYEYLLMAESLGAKPLPVLNNGVTCQFAGHSYIAPLNTPEDRQRFHDIFVKDALDLIEFCNGDANTVWGKKRIELGHPAPFNLEFLSIGNENKGPEFWERFDIIYKEVRAKYPEIKIITTAGAADAGSEFNANYRMIDSLYVDTYVDEHYYKNDGWFYSHRDRYDSDKARGGQGYKYDRSRPTRVFVGEFANNTTNNAFASTLAEAAYFTGLERNADMVAMAAYAPLFCKKGYNKWNSNLIWFDNRGLWHTSNYYYMMLFANNVGNRTFEMSPFYKNGLEDQKVFTSPTIDPKTGVVYVKVVNAEAYAKNTYIKINGSDCSYRAELLYIASDDLKVKNQKDQNWYSSNPDIKDFNYDEAVTPQSKQLGTVGGSFDLNIPANSVCVLRLTPAGPLSGSKEIGLKDAYQDYFTIGVAVNMRNISNPRHIDLIKNNFNSITAENDMKPQPTEPAEGKFNWDNADKVADFCRENGIKLRGHCLVWHSQIGEWMFYDDNHNLVSKEVLLARMKNHIQAIVTRYKDIVYAWDVVNEAMTDDPKVKNNFRQSLLYKIAGEDFIKKAFEYAHEADPNALLFYNDYNAADPVKSKRIYNVVKKMKAQGVPIDGIGMQGHYNIYEPSEKEIDDALTLYSTVVKHIHMTELDIRVNKEMGGALRFSTDEIKISDEIKKLQEDKYEMLFRLLRKHNDVVDNVTFWNLSDKDSWLSPRNYPLPFDEKYQPKKVYFIIRDFDK